MKLPCFKEQGNLSSLYLLFNRRNLDPAIFLTMAVFFVNAFFSFVANDADFVAFDFRLNDFRFYHRAFHGRRTNFCFITINH